MSDFVGLDISGIAELQKKLARLPKEAQDSVIDDVSKYYLNVLQTTQPTPKYVTRRAAYGKPFFSERQRRWFFAALKNGDITVPYRRTQGLKRGWKQVGTGTPSFLVNETKGAEFVVGDKQSRHEAMVGWAKAEDTVKKNMPKAMKKADAAIKKILKKLKLTY